MLSKTDIESKGYKVIIPKHHGKYPKIRVVHRQLKIERVCDQTRSVKVNMNRAYQQMVRDVWAIKKFLKDHN